MSTQEEMNTQMDTVAYHREIRVAQAPEEVFSRICQVSKWWTGDLEGDSEHPGDAFTVHFGKTFVRFCVEASEPGKKLVWRVSDCHLDWLRDKEEWKETAIVFDLSREADQTLIRFTHEGLVPAIECYQDCVKGWDFYAGESLKKLITEGRGLPETPKNQR
ncbi:MAG: SRPBCC family protein [Flavisolibacter sp.]